MAGRPMGVKYWTNANTADTTISDHPVNLYSISISWNGQTIGDRIVIYDSATNDNTAGKIFDFDVPVAAGSYSPVLPAVGLYAEKGLFFNPNVSDQTVNKLKVTIGYDAP